LNTTALEDTKLEKVKWKRGNSGRAVLSP